MISSISNVSTKVKGFLSVKSCAGQAITMKLSKGSQLLFQVIADCYEKRSLIITTNIEFSKWNGIFYDDQLTAALIDRLVHHSHLIVFDRDSWRFEHSLMKDSATK